MALQGVNQQLSSMIERFATVRTGIVTNVDPFGAFVTVGETSIRAAYVRQSEPEIGDVVAVIRQGATWFILGTSSASGDNLVPNPSFELVDDDDLTPTGWVLYNALNTTIAQAVFDPKAVDGVRVLEMYCPTISASCVGVMQSPALSVTVGDTLEVSVYVNGFYPSDNPDTTDPGLGVFWFANATNTYPTTSAADSTIQNVTNITEDAQMQALRGTVVVPAGAVFARVAIRTTALTSAGAHWDLVGVRVVS